MPITSIGGSTDHAEDEGHIDFVWFSGDSTNYAYQLRIVGDPWPTWAKTQTGTTLSIPNLRRSVELRVKGYYGSAFADDWEKSIVVTPPISYTVGGVDEAELANIALGHLGTVTLNDFNENSPEGIHVRRNWALVRDALLRQRHWNFAIKRTTLVLDGAVNLTGVSSENGSADIEVDSATGLSVGMSVKGTFVQAGAKITAIDGTTVTLDTICSTTADSQTATAYNAPAFDYDYGYALPSDYLVALEVNARECGTAEAAMDIEGSSLLCDDLTCQLRYVARVEDSSKWDQCFKEAFALRLAARIATGITTAQGLASQLDQRAEQYLAKAFGPDNTESKPRVVRATERSGWLDARNGSV